MLVHTTAGPHEWRVRKGQPRGTVNTQSPPRWVCSLHYSNPRESTPWHPTPLAGKGDIKNPCRDIDGVGSTPSAVGVRGGARTRLGIWCCSAPARWQHGGPATLAAPTRSLGPAHGEPTTAARSGGNVLLGSRANAHHVLGCACSIPLLVGVPTEILKVNFRNSGG